MLAVRERFIVLVYVTDQFRKIDWELAVCFDRQHIVRTFIIRLIVPAIISISLYDNHIIFRDIISDIVTVVLVAFIKTCILFAAISEITLRPAVKEIDDRIPFLASGRIPRRKKY